MSRPLRFVLLVAGLPLASAAAEPRDAPAPAPVASAAASAESSRDWILDEVVVKGTRSWELQQQMVQVEDRFYALYNQLNADRDFDVHCHIEAPAGRIIKERICRVAFHEDAQAVEVRALLDGHNAPPAAMVAQAREAEFEANFLRVLNSDPRLLRLVREREALEEKYDAERTRELESRRWFHFGR